MWRMPPAAASALASLCVYEWRAPTSSVRKKT
jgi:hypothetical protein